MLAPFWMKVPKRVFDDRLSACHIYVTEQCNLNCHYCSEYENSIPHPSIEDLKLWIGKVKTLGCLRINLQGGEPLLHPDIVDIVQYCTDLDLKSSMSTNGFLLNKQLIQNLERAGLGALQISVDRMTPVDATRKALKSILPKLDLLKDSNLRFHMSGVLFKESLDEARQVIEYGLSHGISTQARLVHADPDGEFGVDSGERETLEALLDHQIHEKRRGRNIHTLRPIFDYQKALLNGGGIDWACCAGYKFIFVSAKGKFWLCSTQREPNIDIMEVTPEILKRYDHEKECQKGCGVYCIISESMALNHPFRFGVRLAWDRLQEKVFRTRFSDTPA
jgi:MoaA/NifB/PqqE/SkfB family radical SAM enzyme